MTNDDRQLLEAYATSGTEAAFAELVRRHFNLVWSAAHRITRDADLARDVAQTVFTDLARKARHLHADTVLPGWLHRAACLAAHKVNRTNQRRTRREREAMELVESNPSADPTAAAAGAEPVLAQLDDALDTLARADREAVLLRYFSRRSLGEVGQTLGVNEDAARKRVNRAVDKLRAWFARRGVETGSATVIAALGLAGSQAAPAGLAGTVAASSFAGMGTLGLVETLLLMKSKLALGLVAVAAVATPLTYQQVSLHRLQAANQQLEAARRQDLAAAAAAQAAAQAAATNTAELERQQAEHLELLRLRGEVGLLRAELAKARVAEKSARAAQAASAATATLEAGIDEKEIQEQREKLIAIKKLNVMKRWALAMHLYASDHNDQFPDTFALMRELFLGTLNGDTVEGGELVLPEDQIEITYHGKLTDVAEPARTIVLREKEARVSAGRLCRAYAFADGHSEIHAAPNGDFTEWERARGVNP